MWRMYLPSEVLETIAKTDENPETIMIYMEELSATGVYTVTELQMYYSIGLSARINPKEPSK